MVDCFSSSVRSEVMRAVKSNGNKSTELRLVNIFKANHISGWRRNFKILGRPDFAFPRKQIAVFADGCFWHGHNCRNTKPKTNAAFWKKKISRNIARDKKNTEKLMRLGWKVYRFLECEINKKMNVRKFNSFIKSYERASRQKSVSICNPKL